MTGCFNENFYILFFQWNFYYCENVQNVQNAYYMNNIISSKTAAAILNVNESTIKRWADSNIIKCIRTPGGHRKFSVEEIRIYAKKYNIEHPALNGKFYNLPAQSNIKQYNLFLNANKVEKYLLKGNSKAVYEILFRLFIQKVHPAIIFDQVVRESFIIIGDKYEADELGVEDEHIASNTMLSALSRFENTIVPRKSNNRKVICCSLENEFHGIGLQCIKIAFLYSGYHCIFPGTNLPFKNLLNLIKETKPEIVCISTSIPDENQVIQKQLENLEKMSKENNFSLFAGGNNSNSHKLPDNVFYNSIEEMFRRINSK